mmetsp:Transcript_174/g.326  ORF Transcript_174/g.326 Transcript_174/m.326 type:complete len:125 (+) Transcript_174:549-923(+)
MMLTLMLSLTFSTCGCCFNNEAFKDHKCVERNLEQNCPVCFEYLFSTTKSIAVLPCGHTIHQHCLSQVRPFLLFVFVFVFLTMVFIADAFPASALERSSHASQGPRVSHLLQVRLRPEQPLGAD